MRLGRKMSDGDTLHWKHDNKKTDTYNLPESLVYTSGPLELDRKQYKANRVQKGTKWYKWYKVGLLV